MICRDNPFLSQLIEVQRLLCLSRFVVPPIFGMNSAKESGDAMSTSGLTQPCQVERATDDSQPQNVSAQQN